MESKVKTFTICLKTLNYRSSVDRIILRGSNGNFTVTSVFCSVFNLMTFDFDSVNVLRPSFKIVTFDLSLYLNYPMFR